MTPTLPCWRVVVRHERRNGALGFFRSSPLTYTQARRELVGYERCGHHCYLDEDEDMVGLHRRVLAGELTVAHAREIAREQGSL